MKRGGYTYRWLLLSAVALTALTAMAETPRLRVLSFNVMGQARGSSLPWSDRSTAMCLTLHKLQADVMGLQEVDSIQATDLAQGLPDYGFVDERLPEGTPHGESNVILYYKKNYKLIDHGTFWLSETPELPSPCWDNPRQQSVCWAVFQSLKSGISFLVANTRFDQLNAEQRLNSSVLIKNYLSKMTNNTPVIFMGSLGCESNEPFYQSLLHRYIPLKDAWESAQRKKGGPDTTNGLAAEQHRVDYIFTIEGVKVRQARVQPALAGQNEVLSDHDLLWVDLVKK
ncbi:MAG: endonuclease/exonuclease/phosphatase family protein [Bacteroidaceae bacterium]|nr:endonuclease/exonuclease/phosphatase family protein [Bacteroidaceae bacterium]